MRNPIRYLQWKYHIQWTKTSEYTSLSWWAFGIWNEYDDWLYNGVHGFRFFGLEINQVTGLLDKFFWKVLPAVRFFNRRTEMIHP